MGGDGVSMMAWRLGVAAGRGWWAWGWGGAWAVGVGQWWTAAASAEGHILGGLVAWLLGVGVGVGAICAWVRNVGREWARHPSVVPRQRGSGRCKLRVAPCKRGKTSRYEQLRGAR